MEFSASRLARRFAPFQGFMLLAVIFFIESAFGFSAAEAPTMVSGVVIVIVWSVLFALNYRGMAFTLIHTGSQKSEAHFNHLRRVLPAWLYKLYILPQERRQNERVALIAQRLFHGFFAVVLLTLVITWLRNLMA